MLNNMYLYNTQLIPEIPQDVIDGRLRLLDEHLSILLDVDMMKRDDKRVAAVLKAVSYWGSINRKDV